MCSILTVIPKSFAAYTVNFYTIDIGERER